MNTELFIANRLFKDKESREQFSRPIVAIAIAGIALGLAVMILSVAIITGFKKEIRKKVIGFGAHIQLVNFDSNASYEATTPVSKNQSFYQAIAHEEGFKHIQVFAYKAGIIKTRGAMQGVILKGIGSDFNWSFYRDNLQRGHIFRLTDTAKTNEVLISDYLSKLLKLDVDSSFIMHFIQQPPRARKFTVAGVYKTDLMEFDETFILGDIGHIQKLNNWRDDQVSGFEIFVDDFNKLDERIGEVYHHLDYAYEEGEEILKIVSIRDKYVQIFDWLNLQDLNVLVILILMTVVAGFNMVSGLLILILERTNMIGILKALGADNRGIRKVFLYLSGLLISRGLLWGNLLGIGICLLQHYFSLIKLDPGSYYLDTVPINLNLAHLILLNAGTLLATFLMLLLPSTIVARITPEKTIRYE